MSDSEAAIISSKGWKSSVISSFSGRFARMLLRIARQSSFKSFRVKIPNASAYKSGVSLFMVKSIPF